MCRTPLDGKVVQSKWIRALAVDQIIDLERPCRHNNCDFVATIDGGLRSHEMVCERRIWCRAPAIVRNAEYRLL